MKLWTVEEIHGVTGFSVRTIYRKIKSGELEARKIGGQYRIINDWVVKWLGCDPLNNPNFSIIVSRTVQTGRKRVTTATETRRETQPKLF